MRLAIITAAGLLLLAACTQQAGAGSAAPSSAASSSAGTDVTVSHTSAGDALAGPDGMTLYIFTADTDGTSACTGDCAASWPAFLGDGSQVNAGDGVSGTFGTTTRDDGSMQITHGGQPLYYYSGDQAAGDSTGEGIGGKWFIAPVDESSASQQEASATPAGPNY
jgi:predicted lipoprotein with Yx(FWY)xxD motif